MTPALPAAATPRTVWVELTSKCPFDCIFCSRKTLRGSGEHMPFALFESLVGQLSDPRTLLLNYSGESTAYPELLPAIRLARASGAFVELVSALASVSDPMLAGIAESGLHRLTVSIHAVDAAQFQEIYRHSSFATLRARLTRFLDLCRDTRDPPTVDAAFVAMESNLAQLPEVAGFIDSLGLRDLFIFPVIRRDDIPAQFTELTSAGLHRPAFQTSVIEAVDQARRAYPQVAFNICNPSFHAAGARLGEVPVPYPGPLPKGAWIHSCEQNPWETAHVLSNGDVVACEVLDKQPLGNIARQPLDQIWNGEPYRQFRHRYRRGEVPECRSCPWKRAYLPGPLQSEIVGSRGLNAQLLHGWHVPVGEAHIWSSQQAVAVLAPRPGSRTVHVCGMLPPGRDGEPNELIVSLNGAGIGRCENPSLEVMTLGLDFAVPPGATEPWYVELRTRHVYRPSWRGAGADRRDLGFALLFIASKTTPDDETVRLQKRRLLPLRAAIEAADIAGACLPRRPVHGFAAPRPGVSVLIPERDNSPDLRECLAGLHQAAEKWTEPIEIIVVVNGTPAASYESLRVAYPSVAWQFHDRPLGFSGAVSAGLTQTRFDWVYLLNTDVVLDPDALAEAGHCRHAENFAVGSQIVLKDPTRFREETNWTSLFVDNGLATIHDRIPQSTAVVDSFYAGGAASFFQARLLRRFAADTRAYDPFYWEDVEWAWRARKLGYRCVFCPSSIAHHGRRATISRHYAAAEVEDIVQRNRLLFQLRNFTRVGSLDRAFDAIAQLPPHVAEYFSGRRVMWEVVRARLRNHTAPIRDEEVCRP